MRWTAAILQSLHLRHAIAPEEGESEGVPDLPITMAVLTSHCCCHAVHNSVKWALSLSERAEAGKQLWAITTSLRSAFVELQGGLLQFIHERCIFGDHPWTLPPATAQELYTLLGVPTDMLEQYVELQPTFQDGHLYVRAVPDQATEMDEQLMSLLLHALRFAGFSESRWCSLGDSSRALLLSMSMGLTTIVSIAQQHKQSQYGLTGAEGLASPEVRSLILDASIVTASPDALLSNMLGDDRIILTKDRLVEIMRTELRYLLLTEFGSVCNA